MAASIHMVVIKISIFRTSMYLRANSIGKKFSLCISRALTDTHNIFCLIHRIISTVNKQIRPAESLPCANKYIRVEEPGLLPGHNTSSADHTSPFHCRNNI